MSTDLYLKKQKMWPLFDKFTSDFNDVWIGNNVFVRLKPIILIVRICASRSSDPQPDTIVEGAPKCAPSIIIRKRSTCNVLLLPDNLNA